jgi:hypothetical protein
MDRQELLRSFVRKARNADRKAALVVNMELRLVWEEVARNWRLLARQVRTKTEAELS